MHRYLVVANQTLASDELWSEIHVRMRADPEATFYVVVPNTAARHYHVVPSAGGFIPMPTVITESVPTTDQEATARAQELLDDLLNRLKGRAPAHGELGDADPFEAIQSVVSSRQFDEVLLSTLPERHSRWHRMDVAQRVQRAFDVPVTTIAAKH